MPQISAPSPRVSIVMPMFNSEKFIRICIDSILNQTFKDFELIVVNDCSTDRSAEIVESYQDPRIKIYRNVRNLGTGMARNFGITIAAGKYIYFIDHDDAILPQTLEMFFNSAEESQAEVVYMNSRLNAVDPDFDLANGIQARRMFSTNPTPRFMSENLLKRLQREHIEIGVLWEPWIKFFRRDFLIENQIYFPAVFGCEDWLMNLAALCLAKKIRVIDFAGYIFRPNPNSVTHSSAEKSFRKLLESSSTIISYMEEIFSKTDLSRENQVILESHMIYSLIQMQIRYKPLAIDSMDKILREESPIDPEILRVLIHVISILISRNYKFELITK